MSSEDKESQPFNIGFKQIPMTRPSLLRSENLLTAQHIMRAHSPHMLALSHWRVESVTMSPCHHGQYLFKINSVSDPPAPDFRKENDQLISVNHEYEPLLQVF